MGQYGAIIIVVLVLAFAIIRSKSTHFECPNCGQSFKVSSLKYIFSFHAGASRYATCPHCHEGKMMVPVPDSKKKDIS